MNWVVLNEKSSAAQKDVTELGKVLGVKFKGDPNNSFNLLTREGRKEWRAAGGVGGNSIDGIES